MGGGGQDDKLGRLRTEEGVGKLAHAGFTAWSSIAKGGRSSTILQSCLAPLGHPPRACVKPNSLNSKPTPNPKA